jgi:hypothetical protein
MEFVSILASYFFNSETKQKTTYINEQSIDTLFNDIKFKLLLLLCVLSCILFAIYHFIKISSTIILWTLYIVFLHVIIRILEIYFSSYIILAMNMIQFLIR